MKQLLFSSFTALSFALFTTGAIAHDYLSCASGTDSSRGQHRSSKASQKLNVTVLTQIENGQALMCVNEHKASQSTLIGVIGGLIGDTKLIGIDYRVQDGALYAVGDLGGVYKVNSTNASLTLVNNLGFTPQGSLFGIDFNPAADRLRIVSDTGQNLRHNVNPGGITLQDTALNNGALPAVGVAGVVSAAYTNNDLQPATATTLFVINNVTDAVAIQSPANSGVVVNTGNLAVNVSGPVGFDIYSDLRHGVVTGNRALASATDEGETTAKLFTVDVLTGEAKLRSKFAWGVKVIDIAIPLNQNYYD